MNFWKVGTIVLMLSLGIWGSLATKALFQAEDRAEMWKQKAGRVSCAK